MKIYAMRNDGIKYQELDLISTDILDFFPPDIDEVDILKFSLRNTSLKKYWQLRKTGWHKIEGEENLIPDITNWIDASLVLSPKAHRYLEDLMKPFGEFLPIQIEDDKDPHYIFNCLTVAEVDEAQSNPEENKMMFLEESVGDNLFFKTPYQGCLDLYCTERAKDLIQSLEFQGIVFDERLYTEFPDTPEMIELRKQIQAE